MNHTLRRVRKPAIPVLLQLVREPEKEVAFARIGGKWQYIRGQERTRASVSWYAEYEHSLHSHTEGISVRPFRIRGKEFELLEEAHELYTSPWDVMDLLNFGKSGDIAYMLDARVAAYLFLKKIPGTPLGIPKRKFSTAQKALVKNLLEWYCLRRKIRLDGISARSMKKLLQAIRFIRQKKNWAKAGLKAEWAVKHGFRRVRNRLGFDYIVKDR